MALEPKTKDLLNKLADSQPGLNDKDLPRSQSGIKLGDLLNEAHGALRTAKALYTPARDGGTSGSTYVLSGEAVPQGAIITRAWIAEDVALVGVGASLNIQIGATSLTGGAQAITALVGILESKADLSATLPEATSGGKVTVAVSGANVTAGQLLIAFEYIYPVSI